jgi:hypothetical protein
MPIPEKWIKGAIEDAAEDCLAWPVAMTGTGDPPYVVYFREGTARDSLLGDIAAAPVATFRLDIYADSHVQAWEIAEAVGTALNRFKGTAYGLTIELCLLTDERDGDAVRLDGREDPTYIVEQTYTISWQE